MCLNSGDLISPCSPLEVGCCSLQPCCWERSAHGSATHSALGNVVLLHPLQCVLLGITRLPMNYWGWDLLPYSSSH